MSLNLKECASPVRGTRRVRRLDDLDWLQVVLRVTMLLRGAWWTLAAQIVMKSPHIGAGLSCFGWPRLTHRNGELIVGERCFFGAGEFKVTRGARLILGDRVLLNDGFVVSANEGIEIGADTLVGEFVSIRDADHEFSRMDIPIAAQGFRAAPIKIGEDVWIGRGSVILKGVTIGRGAVVGANSVVTKDVAPYDIVAGNPARRIRSRIEPQSVSSQAD